MELRRYYLKSPLQALVCFSFTIECVKCYVTLKSCSILRIRVH
uniref:ADP-ribosylation factor-related protein 1-like isoform X1 n=1 Tax=Rhizophora mucronata TaxID=61149 RepID=A0A2P2L2D3_RHIMU